MDSLESPDFSLSSGGVSIVSEPYLPLARFKVLDLTQARSGPTAVRQLADWGAEVIKIELPASMGVDVMGGRRHGFDFQNLHRNKKSLTLNLKTKKGLGIFFELAKWADVIVENYRPRVKERLGIDYEAVRRVNPGIVYGSISGFGQMGPYAERPGLDQIAQGMSGLMSVTGEPGGGPMRAGVPVSDLSAGMILAQGILMALLDRERTGEGRWIYTSLLEAQIQMMDLQMARYLMAGEVPGQAGNNHPTFIPTGVFETADGLINIQAGGQRLWERLTAALGAPELVGNPDYIDMKSRLANRDALNARINALTARKNTEEWVMLLNEAGIPCGPIYSVDQTMADPQVETLGMAPEVHHIALGRMRVVGQALKMGVSPQPMRSAAPEPGEHTEELLKELLGYDAAQIEQLREEGVA